MIKKNSRRRKFIAHLFFGSIFPLNSSTFLTKQSGDAHCIDKLLNLQYEIFLIYLNQKF